MNKYISAFFEILKLPAKEISFKNCCNECKENYLKTYRYFTKPHRFKLFKNKSIGVALINLTEYDTFEQYYKSINGKNSAAYYARKAIRRGYKFIEIDRNDYINDIYEINTSSEIRQGRKMPESYLKKVEKYQNEKNYRYFGVVNKDGVLVAYCNIGFYGEFALISSLLGHKEYLNDGIMYLMMVEVNKIVLENYKKNGCKYIMYDTFFGASNGLKKFKQKLGYKPYRVKWKLEC